MSDETSRGAGPSRRLLLRGDAATAALPFGLGIGSVRAHGPEPARFYPGPLCRPAAAAGAASRARHR